MKEDSITIIDIAVEKFGNRESSLIPVLQEIEKKYGYIPEDCLNYLSKSLKVPVSRIYGIVTFYAQFHLVKRGRYTIRVCRGTACHVRGAETLLDAVKNYLKIEDGQTTPDYTFTLETVACLGSCALAPVMLVNDDYYGKVNPKMIELILKKYSQGDNIEA